MSAEGAIEVIIHEAPTAWMRLPKFETRLALQIDAKMREWNGASVGEARQDPGNRDDKRERTVTPGNTLSQLSEGLYDNEYDNRHQKQRGYFVEETVPALRVGVPALSQCSHQSTAPEVIRDQRCDQR